MTFEKSSGDAAAVRVEQQYLDPVELALGQAALKKRGDPQGWHARLGRGRARGPAPASSSRTRWFSRGTVEEGGARHQRAALLPAQRRPGQGARDAGARPPAAADGRAGEAADEAAARCRTSRPTAARRAASGCPRAPSWWRWRSAEALGPGDAQRGHVRAVPVRLRRHGLEPAAAVRRRAAATPARGLAELRPAPVPRAGRSGRARRRPAARRGSRCTRCRPSSSRGIESSGWLRWLLDRWGLDYREVTRRGDQGGRPGRRRGPARPRRVRDARCRVPRGPVRARRPRAGGPGGDPDLGGGRWPLRRLARRRRASPPGSACPRRRSRTRRTWPSPRPAR